MLKMKGKPVFLIWKHFQPTRFCDQENFMSIAYRYEAQGTKAKSMFEDII